MAQESMPVCVSGDITAAHPSLCMDEATHLIHTSIVGSIRLVATNDAVLKALEEFEESNEIATVCGYPARTVNCSHLAVYCAVATKELGPKLEAFMGGFDGGS